MRWQDKAALFPDFQVPDSAKVAYTAQKRGMTEDAVVDALLAKDSKVVYTAQKRNMTPQSVVAAVIAKSQASTQSTPIAPVAAPPVTPRPPVNMGPGFAPLPAAERAAKMKSVGYDVAPSGQFQLRPDVMKERTGFAGTPVGKSGAMTAGMVDDVMTVLDLAGKAKMALSYGPERARMLADLQTLKDAREGASAAMQEEPIPAAAGKLLAGLGEAMAASPLAAATRIPALVGKGLQAVKVGKTLTTLAGTSAHSATTLALMSGLGDAARQLADTGRIDMGQSMKAAGHGAVMGGLMGTVSLSRLPTQMAFDFALSAGVAALQKDPSETRQQRMTRILFEGASGALLSLVFYNKALPKNVVEGAVGDYIKASRKLIDAKITAAGNPATAEAVRRQAYSQLDAVVADRIAKPLQGGKRPGLRQSFEVDRQLRILKDLPNVAFDVASKTPNQPQLAGPMVGPPKPKPAEAPLGIPVNPLVPYGVTPEQAAARANEANRRAVELGTRAEPVTVPLTAPKDVTTDMVLPALRNLWSRSGTRFAAKASDVARELGVPPGSSAVNRVIRDLEAAGKVDVVRGKGMTMDWLVTPRTEAKSEPSKSGVGEAQASFDRTERMRREVEAKLQSSGATIGERLAAQGQAAPKTATEPPSSPVAGNGAGTKPTSKAVSAGPIEPTVGTKLGTKSTIPVTPNPKTPLVGEKAAGPTELGAGINLVRDIAKAIEAHTHEPGWTGAEGDALALMNRVRARLGEEQTVEFVKRVIVAQDEQRKQEKPARDAAKAAAQAVAKQETKVRHEHAASVTERVLADIHQSTFADEAKFNRPSLHGFGAERMGTVNMATILERFFGGMSGTGKREIYNKNLEDPQIAGDGLERDVYNMWDRAIRSTGAKRTYDFLVAKDKHVTVKLPNAVDSDNKPLATIKVPYSFLMQLYGNTLDQGPHGTMDMMLKQSVSDNAAAHGGRGIPLELDSKLPGKRGSIFWVDVPTLEAMVNTLKPTGLHKFIDALVEHSSTRDTPAARELSLRILGYDITGGSERYWPRAMSSEAVKASTEYRRGDENELLYPDNASNADITAADVGALRERTGHNHPLLLTDPTESWLRRNWQVISFLTKTEARMKVRAIMNGKDLPDAIKRYIPDGKEYNALFDRLLREWEVPSFRSNEVMHVIQSLAHAATSGALGFNPSPGLMQTAGFATGMSVIKPDVQAAVLKRMVTGKSAVDASPWRAWKNMKRLSETPNGGTLWKRYFSRQQSSGASLMSGTPELTSHVTAADDVLNTMRRTSTMHIQVVEMGLMNVFAEGFRDAFNAQNTGRSAAQIDNAVAKHLTRLVNDTQGGVDALTTTKAGVESRSNPLLRLPLLFTSESAKKTVLIRRFVNDYQWSKRTPSDKSKLAFRLTMLAASTAHAVMAREGLKLAIPLTAAVIFRRDIKKFLQGYASSRGWSAVGGLVQNVAQDLGGPIVGVPTGLAARGASQLIQGGNVSENLSDDVLSSAATQLFSATNDVARMTLAKSKAERERARGFAGEHLAMFGASLTFGASPIRNARSFLEGAQRPPFPGYKPPKKTFGGLIRGADKR
jgi:hypothetical protein